MSKTPKMIIAGIGAIFLIVAIIFFITHGGKKTATDPDRGSTPVVNAADYDITGEWYSDRENGDTLTFTSDGSYTSTDWIAPGSYTFDGNTVILKDVFAENRTLTLSTIGEEYVLIYSGAASHTYHRTEAKATSAREAAAKEEAEMQGFYDAAFIQILTTGDWVNDDEMYITTAHFTENSFAVSCTLNENYTNFSEEELEEYHGEYTIVSIEAANGTYIAKATFKEDGKSYTDSGDISITAGENNTYTLLCHNLPYAYKYTKTAEIVLVQPQSSTTGKVSEQDIADANSSHATADPTGSNKTGDRVVVGEDGSIDRITQLSRNDNPDRSEQLTEVAKLTEKEIIGTWQGTFEDMPNANTVYWVFVFKADGTYTFTDGSISESGTYSLTHQYEKYHSTMHLVPSTGEAKDRRFYLSGDKQISLTIEGDTHPTYLKK